MRSLTIFAIISGLYAGSAAAESVECGRAEAGVISVDGMVDDWQGVTGLANGNKDAGYTVLCNYDDNKLYVAVMIKDERIIRFKGKKRSTGEDRAVLTLGGASFTVYPTDGTLPSVTLFSSKKLGKSATLVDSLQQRGWSFELALPLSVTPGYARGVPGLRFALTMHDADMASAGKVEQVLSTGDALLAFDDAVAMYQQVLESLGLKAKSLKLDVLAEMDGSKGIERVLAGGDVLVVMSEGYTYVQLPVEKPKDVQEVRVVDLAGEGTSSIIARYVERGNGGSREVLTVWNIGDDGNLARSWAHEIGKQAGASKMTNAWELVPKTAGKGKKKRVVPGYDLVVRAGEVTGFTEETWRETPASDMNPIILPWAEKRQETWHFQADEVYGGE